MCSVHSFSLPARILIGLWAGIVFFGGVAYAQEKNIDTVHIFKADTVRLGFDDVLPLSAVYDSADREDWHYIYRWNTGERTDGIQVKFNGQRKVLYTGKRFSAIHWPGEYDTLELDTFVNQRYIYFYCRDPKDDTVILRAPDMEGTNIKYAWSNNFYFDEECLLPDTEQYAVVYWDITKPSLGGYFSCRATAVSAEGDTTVLQSVLALSFHYGGNDGIVQTPPGRRFHDYNVWSMPEWTQIYARLGDTLHFFSEMDYDVYPEYAYVDEYELTDCVWYIYPCRIMIDGIHDSAINIYFKDNTYRTTIQGNPLYRTPSGAGSGVGTRHHVFWGVKPNAEIETDSVWVFFPYYPYSNLGGRVDICLPPDAPLPADSDTVQVFNLGPWNRELEYVEYAWFDGTKDVSGGDSIVGTDSAFAYLFGRMDSVAPDLYTGTLVTRVASDSLWQDTCGCYIPCTDAACSGYDTVQIYLHLLPSLKENVFLPRDSVLCAHLDLELQLPDTAADAYRCFWLDKDSIEMPYGHDTTRFTVQGMRGLDGYGAGTDTREPRLFQLRLDHKVCGISFFDTLLVYDQVKPAFTLPCHDTLICRNEPVELDSLSPHVYHPFYVFEWNDGTQGSAYTFTDSGTYVLQFFVEKAYAFCGYDTASDTLRTVWVDPAMTDIFLPSDTTFCKDLSVTLDVRVPFPSTRYSWQDGPMPDPEEEFEEEQDSIIFTSPIKTIKEEGTYNVLLLDSMGCKNRQEINVTIDDCKPAIDIPNVFTPNGDGVNDVWRFKQLEKCTDVVIEVVDRWGQPVLKKKVPSANDFEWNGRVNNTGARLPDGPYFYMVSYKNLYGKGKVQSGSITILGTAE